VNVAIEEGRLTVNQIVESLILGKLEGNHFGNRIHVTSFLVLVY
jgi:hypothetical protein